MRLDEANKIIIGKILNNTEKITLPPCKGLEVFYEKNKKLITEKIWDKLITKELVCFQCIGDNQLIYHNLFYKIENGHETVFDTQEIKTSKKEYRTFTSNHAISRACCDPIFEAILCNIIASQIANEIDELIIETMKKCCSTKNTFDFETASGNTINEKLVEVTNVIDRKFLDMADFIVVNGSMANFLQHTTNFKKNEDKKTLYKSGISYLGILNNKWKVFQNKFDQASPSILLGYSGADRYLRSGLKVGVKILLEVGKATSPFSTSENHGLYGDFEMKFGPGGQNCYAVIDVKNCPQIQY